MSPHAQPTQAVGWLWVERGQQGWGGGDGGDAHLCGWVGLQDKLHEQVEVLWGALVAGPVNWPGVTEASEAQLPSSPVVVVYSLWLTCASIIPMLGYADPLPFPVQWWHRHCSAACGRR